MKTLVVIWLAAALSGAICYTYINYELNALSRLNATEQVATNAK